jgi:hypothetical protein
MTMQPDFFAVVAATLAVVLLLDISVLWLTGRQVPELLSQLIFGVFGFYFGRAPAQRGQPQHGIVAPHVHERKRAARGKSAASRRTP